MVKFLGKEPGFMPMKSCAIYESSGMIGATEQLIMRIHQTCERTARRVFLSAVRLTRKERRVSKQR